MKEIDYKDYHSYLQTGSIKSKLYRKYWLYPRLSSFLDGKALDVGSGLGDFVSYRKNTIGVDINPDNVKWCVSKGLNVQVMDLDKLPFESAFFDSIIMDNVLEHIEDPENILSEIDRVIKIGGNLVIGVPGILGFESAPDHKVFYSKEMLVKTFVNRNYSVKKVFSMPIEMKWLDSRISQYCYYAVFIKN
jgi:SAM-dependent methyltransferase